MRLAGRPARLAGPRRSGEERRAVVVQRAEQFGRGEEGKGRRQCRQVGPGHRWERARVLAGFAGLRERVGRAGEEGWERGGASWAARLGCWRGRELG